MDDKPQDQPTPDAPETAPGPLPIPRLAITGVFMGLANLVPGVSGGTMVLALGLYEEFIGAFSDLTRLRITRRAITVVAMLFGISAVTIFTLAGVIQSLMENALPAMLALFIGMTLGGVPFLWREMKPLTKTGVAFAIVAFIVMGLIAFVFKPGGAGAGWTAFFVGGIVGSSAMILPGISGSYMLLIMGLYLPIIAGINSFKEALKLRDMGQFFDVGFGVILPVGLGLVVGLVVLTNLLKYLMRAHHRATIGFLMGLLLGSVLGLYPFKGPDFHKLARYAVDTKDGRELRVIGYGWKPDSETSRIHKALMALGKDDLAVRAQVPPEGPVTTADIERARAEKAIVIAYDVEVSRDVRRAAEDKKAGEVELVIVADTEFGFGRLVSCLFLIVVGFCLTFFLGRLGGGKEGTAKA